MSEIKFDYKNGQLFLEGAEGKRFEYRHISPKKDFISEVNFYRIDNNFGYVQGRINFSHSYVVFLLSAGRPDKRWIEHCDIHY